MEVTVIVTTLWQAAAVVNSGLLLMAVMGLLFPAVLHYTHSEVHYGKSELALSRFSSCIMLVAYAFYLVFQLKGQNESYDRVNENKKETRRKRWGRDLIPDGSQGVGLRLLGDVVGGELAGHRKGGSVLPRLPHPVGVGRLLLGHPAALHTEIAATLPDPRNRRPGEKTRTDRRKEKAEKNEIRWEGRPRRLSDEFGEAKTLEETGEIVLGRRVSKSGTTLSSALAKPGGFSKLPGSSEPFSSP
ncbi:hypothetical protein B296_00041780 [Ensete ventricosum]|uniref:Sodium/calcium exchanger membrane region domain-containing protein n=1 Tax=Ensete ventricosum TaxID=4639 RepID=A0A426ZKJ3_ENSVE|nr:hypothetical protein B296_00041780 [Ensete ventricosum]